MAEVKWIKITTSMFEDEKIDFIESLPEADTILIIWVKLLTLAGKCNSNGFIFLTEKIPYTEEMLAHKFRRSLNTVKLALETLAKLEMIELDNGGFLKITNWEKHQNVEGLDKIREQTRLRVAKHRESKKLKQLEDGESNVTCNVTVTEGNAIEREEEGEEDIDIDIEEDIDKEPPVPYEKIKELYNSICKSLSQVRSISSTRKNHLKARWKQFKYELDTFREAFEKVEASKFCTGTNDRGWKADFDWLIKNDNNMVKVLEGKYDDKGGGDDFTKDNKTTTGEFYDFSNY
ncbi:phage replisome organizer N-terminal domain-containing protein [Clostridium tepidum]